MKRIITILLILIVSAGYAQEKNTQIGVKVGGNFVFPSGDLKEDFGTGQPGYNIGLFTRENKGKVNVLFEAFYSTCKIKQDDYSLNLNTFNFPIFIETAGDKKFSGHAGLNPVIVVSSKTKALNVESSENIKPFGLDIAAGFGVRMAEQFHLTGRVSYPLLNYSNQSRDYYPIQAQLSIQYSIFNIQ